MSGFTAMPSDLRRSTHILYSVENDQLDTDRAGNLQRVGFLKKHVVQPFMSLLTNGRSEQKRVVRVNSAISSTIKKVIDYEKKYLLWLQRDGYVAKGFVDQALLYDPINTFSLKNALPTKRPKIWMATQEPLSALEDKLRNFNEINELKTVLKNIQDELSSKVSDDYKARHEHIKTPVRLVKTNEDIGAFSILRHIRRILKR